MKVIIIGSGSTGAAVASRMCDAGHTVHVIELDRNRADTLPQNRVQSGAITVLEGDGTSPDVLESAGISEADVFVTATGDDTVNGLAAQRAKIIYRVETVIASVKDEDLGRLYGSLGVIAINPTRLTADQIIATAIATQG